jgi:hypothetical protein
MDRLPCLDFVVIVAPVSDPIAQYGSPAQNICLACGLCCNGVIFADVKLLPSEEAGPLLSLGMPLLRTKTRPGPQKTQSWRFLQPCAAFDGCRCRIYASRPKYCREFDCFLLKKVQQGRVTQKGALRVILDARRRAEKVRELLRVLGDTHETLALADRFRRMAKRLERSKPDLQRTEVHGRLTLAFHELNLALSKSFYASLPNNEGFANGPKAA